MTRKELKDLKEDAKAWGVYADAYQAGYDAGKAEKALQEREERSKGCSFCRVGKIPANYCPGCGRKLRKEK